MFHDIFEKYGFERSCTFFKIFSGLQAKIKEHKELVAQLQRELDVNRIKVSEAVADIHKVFTFCTKYA